MHQISVNNPLGRQNAIMWGLFLGLLGFAGNWFKFELFFNVDFLFGSLFVMLAVIRFGTVAGVIAGAVAASCTFLLWNHPWAIIILTLEAAFVAWRFRLDREDLLTIDIFFWLFIGAPLIWLFYSGILLVGNQSALLIVLKQSVNGVFNALLASAIHLLLRIRSRNPYECPSFQEILFITMVTIILIPSFIYLVFKIRDEIRSSQEQIAETALHTNTEARSAIDQWIQAHHQNVKLLAALVGSSSSADVLEIQHIVDLMKLASPTFLKMGVLNRNSVIVAYSPQFENGASNIGVSFADRLFIPMIRDTLQPYIPDMVPGKLGSKVPVLPLLAPMSDKNGYAGFCVGTVDLLQAKRMLLDLVTRHHENITILDRNGNVVVSTRDDLKTMEHFQRSSRATVIPISDGYYHWIPETRKGSSSMVRWMSSLYVSETIVSSSLPWKVVIEVSPLPMLSKLSASSINAFLMMFTIIVLSSVFARFISRSYVRSLQILQEETKHIPDLLDDKFPEQDSHISRIKELNGLTQNFRQMTQLLYDRMHEVRKVNQARLVSVEMERKHLHEKEMLVRDLHDGIGGLMTKISMLAQYAKSNNGFESYVEIMDKILVLAYEGGAEVRSFMNSLESDQPAWGDLLAEISEYCDYMFEHDNPSFTISSSIVHDAPSVGLFRYVNVVRIFRETVANILKHADAHSVLIKFTVNSERFLLSVSDDGLGYDSASVRKRGVANMYSRAGLLGADFSIESSLSEGTSVTLSIPISETEMESPCA